MFKDNLEPKKYFNKYLVQVIFLVLIVGTVLRIASFTLNTRLQGDVNLFALTAREFVQHGRLYYPMKYEFSDNVPYKSLASPASQHPPLWPLVAGLLGKMLSTDATFPLLKFLCEVVGIGMLLFIGIVGWNRGLISATLVALTLCSFSPILVDFSGNGSSYILIAMALLLTSFLMERYNPERQIDYALAGLLCAMSLQLHTNTILLPICFLCYWYFVCRTMPWRGIAIAAFTVFLTLLPWMLWNYYHFGMPLYSYSTNFFLKAFGFAKVSVVNDAITMSLTSKPLDSSFVIDYVLQLRLVTLKMLTSYYDNVGPFSLSLMFVGLISIVRANRRVAVVIFLPFLCYATTIVMWGTWRDRFIVPLVPVAFLGAAAGFTILVRGHKLLRGVAWMLFAASILWNVNRLWKGSSTYYYSNPSWYAASYDAMIPLAKELGKLEKGTVLGYSQKLDGGIETVYWHRQSFVCGRELPIETIEKVTKDFGIRYIWVDTENYNKVKISFPNASEILSNFDFHLIEIPQT